MILLLVYCLSSAPDRCITQRHPVDGSQMGCLVQAQREAAEWLEARPGYELRRFVCGPVGDDI